MTVTTTESAKAVLTGLAPKMTPIMIADGMEPHAAMLSAGQWYDRLYGRLITKGHTDLEAAVALDAAVAFLSGKGHTWSCGGHTEAPCSGGDCQKDTEPGKLGSPDDVADLGWHTMILYTAEYRAFCQVLAGRFIEHHPSDVIGLGKERQPGDCYPGCDD